MYVFLRTYEILLSQNSISIQYILTRTLLIPICIHGLVPVPCSALRYPCPHILIRAPNIRALCLYLVSDEITFAIISVIPCLLRVTYKQL